MAEGNLQAMFGRILESCDMLDKYTLDHQEALWPDLTLEAP